MRITQYKTILNDDQVVQLVKEKATNYTVLDNLCSAIQVYMMLCDIFQHDKQTEEYVYLICLNTKSKPVGIFELSHGSINASICNTREIFQKALLCNVSKIIIAHNHPSTDINPSQNDIKTYNNIKNAGELMQIPLCDFIVVGEGYYSFQEHGLL